MRVRKKKRVRKVEIGKEEVAAAMTVVVRESGME
jgi:hypothetical protein